MVREGFVIVETAILPQSFRTVLETRVFISLRGKHRDFDSIFDNHEKNENERRLFLGGHPTPLTV